MLAPSTKSNNMNVSVCFKIKLTKKGELTLPLLDFVAFFILENLQGNLVIIKVGFRIKIS